MGRPKKNTVGLSAEEKIENAFWKILEFEDFENITILRLTQETGLNRNTIYYHYQNVEDIAEKAIKHNMEQRDVEKFAAIILSIHDDYPFDPELLLHAKRIHLLAGSKSMFLQSFAKKKLLNTWIDCFDIDTCKLSKVDCASMEFIASGIISIIGSDTFMDHPVLLSTFPTSLIGKAAIQTLRSLPKKI